MRLAVIGGGGFRVPLVFGAVLQDESRLVDEVVLHDVSADRLGAIAAVLDGQRAVGSGRPRTTLTDDLDRAVRGADIVFCAIRPGGLAGRAQDERAAIAAGVLGQETIGAGGVLFGLRSVPAAHRIAEVVAAQAPNAWVINFTNPAGLVTEAMAALIGDRVIGICDSPLGLCRRVARVLGVPFARVWFDYAGLNHLGWLRGAYVDGLDLLPTLLADDVRVESFEEGRLFGGERLRQLGAVPNEYLHYWYDAPATGPATPSPATPSPATPTRGEYLLAQQERFYSAAAARPDAALSLWQATRREREETYLQEARPPGERRAEEDLSGGYEGVALAVMRAIARDEAATLILDVRNRSALPGLDTDAVVEVPCLVDSNGAHPMAVDPLGASELDLVRTVKRVERLTIEAALSSSPELVEQALAAHPLVGPAAARRLVEMGRAPR